MQEHADHDGLLLEEKLSRVVGCIYMALMDAPASTEDHAIHLDFTQSPSCLGISAEDIAAALRDQDDDTLSAVAGRPVTKLSSIPTGVAI